MPFIRHSENRLIKQVTEFEIETTSMHKLDELSERNITGINFLSGFKNKIINGDFRIWQRGASKTLGTGTYVSDRFVSWGGNWSGITQQTISKQYYSGAEFNGCIYHNSADAINSTVSQRCFGVCQRVEITSDNYKQWFDKYYTVSLWIRSNLSQCELYVQARTTSSTARLAYKEFSIVPDIWQKISWTYFLSTSQLVENGLTPDELMFVQLFGISFGSNSYWPETSTWPSINTGDYFELAYIQVEEGQQVTEFELRPFSTELELCQRYYEKSYQLDDPPGTAVAAGAIKTEEADITYSQQNGVLFKTTKRANPTVTIYSPMTGNSGYAYDPIGAVDRAVSVIQHSQFGIFAIVYTSAFTGSGIVQSSFHYVADAEL